MVSSLLADALRDPTQALIDLYGSGDHSDFAAAVSRHFDAIFGSADAFDEIPVLGVKNGPSSHPSGSLVRFRGMVQDTSSSPEMYLSKLRQGRPGGWGIETTLPDSESDVINYADLRECSTFWAVSVPGESEWCTRELDGPSSASSSAGHSSSSTRSHKYPITNTPHVGVQLKIYDNAITESFKTTELGTFVGILSSESYSYAGHEDQAEVPTMHVLFARPHASAVISRPFPAAPSAPESTGDALREELITWIADEALGGDREAAEWILLTCLGRVQSRNPPLLPPSLTLSRFPVPPPQTSPASTSSSSSITSAPASASAQTPTLSYILSLLLPLFSTLPLSLDKLNQDAFAPSSHASADAEGEDLHSGALQLPQGSVVLVTEAGVQEGKLVEKGVMNIRSLQEVLSTQSLAYQFPYSSFSFPTDISFIILAEGSKSAFFQTDLVLPLDLKNGADLYKPASSVTLPSPEKLAAFRALVVGAKGAPRIGVSEGTSEHIQADFVAERQAQPCAQDKVTSEDLIQRMTLAKLYALSSNEPELTVDTWKRTKALDASRRARLL